MKVPSEEDLKNLSKDDLFYLFEATRKAWFEKISDLNVSRMRKKSKKIDTDSLLVVFLYILVRDDITPGRLEQILLAISNDNADNSEVIEKFQLTNGWLALYCKDVAERLLKNRKTGNKKLSENSLKKR